MPVRRMPLSNPGRPGSPATWRLPTAWPEPGDPQAADRLCQTLEGAAPPALLRCLGGNSPYLSELAEREAAALKRLVRHGPDAVVAEAMAALAKIPPQSPRPRIAAGLRQAKRVIALATAIADLGDIWGLDQITAALSALAEATIRLAVNHLLRAAHDAGELRLRAPDDPALGCGFTVLGMGKLGARELNYSSDVDLILLHDPEGGPLTARAGNPGAFFARLARNLVALMEARDPDGYVFRTDLRLRPDPAATPPSMSMPAAIAYYESMGQNWERAAMLKARPIAGDIPMGLGFLEAIRPFVWRRHLDFAAVADIHAMKRRIDQHRNRSSSAKLTGFNVKLGQGGIREIEFLCQTLQLVWGGRDPALRIPRTLDALPLLVRAGHLPAATATRLAAAYRFLRRVEHRLQMVADRQTHTLPEQPVQMDAFAVFMAYPTTARFEAALLRHLAQVQAAYRRVFASVEPSPDAQPRLDFGGNEPPTETVAALQMMNFHNPAAIVAAVQAWQAGRPRALRSARARDLLANMLPNLLAALGRQAQPDAAFARFDQFIERLPAGVQPLSLFERNPALLDRVAAVLGAAPSLADYLTRTPSALEGLLTPSLPPPGEYARMLTARLADARGLEDSVAIIRTCVRAEGFALTVATMEGHIDADAAGIARAALTDAAIQALLPPVLADFATRFGRVRGGGIAVVVLGKAGSREAMAGSDLDLMFLYDHPEAARESRGRRALPSSQYFIRTVQAYVAALIAPDAEGPMFEVDMRLRPSGNKGPVAVSLAAFARYHAEDAAQQAGAWTWERMALTRARVVAGPPPLRARVETAIRAAIAAGDPAAILPDAVAMRRRMLKELPPDGPWDAKLRPGGQIEVEFVAQALTLLHARAQPGLADPTTRIALARLAESGFLEPDAAALLIRADRLWRTVQGMLRITYGRRPPDLLPDAPAAALLRACAAASAPAVDLAQLRATLDALALQVRRVFNTHVGPIET